MKMNWKNVFYAVMMFAIFVPCELKAQEPILEWAQKYRAPGEMSGQWTTGVTTDNSGNVFVTGVYYSSNNGVRESGVQTVKYDSNGNQLWARQYVGGDDCPERCSLSTDSEGSLYITQLGLTTIKYDKNGNEVWVRKPAGYIWYGNGQMVVGQSGNIYVAGMGYKLANDGSWSRESILIKYSPSGNTEWMRSKTYIWGGGSNVAVDSSENIYILAGKNVAKYDSSGNEVWTVESPLEYTSFMTVNSAGNVYIADGRFDVAMIDSSGNTAWVVYGTGNSYYIGVDPSSGNLYVAGSGYSKAIVVKYDSLTGNKLWESSYEYPNGYGWIYYSNAVDASGNIYLTGSVKADSDPYNYIAMDFLTLKFDSNGNLSWAATYDSGSYDFGMAATVDAKGNVYVTGGAGQIPGGNTPYEYLTVKYSQSPTIKGLIAVINSSGITNNGIKTSLLQKIENAERLYDAGNAAAARNILQAFINELEALSGSGKIDSSIAIRLINIANALIKTV